MKKYQFGIIGCGRIAERHFNVLGGMKKAEISVVCDTDEKKARETAKKLEVPYYTEYMDMIRKEKLDIVNILTPSGTHAEIAMKCADYIKNIIVEKPMALRLEDADMLIEKCIADDVNLFVVKQNRYNLPVQKLKEAIDQGRFGKIVMATVRVRWMRDQQYYDSAHWRGTWAMDGGVLANQASHHVDLLQWLVGPVESVIGKTARQLVDIETEDTAVAIIKFVNGAIGVIEATTAARPKDLEGSITIMGENGTVEIGGFAVNEIKHWIFADETVSDKEVKEKYSVNPPDIYGYGHREFLTKVIESLDKGIKGPVDGLEGRKSLELINAIYESAETRSEVSLRFKQEYSRLGEKKGEG